MPQKPLLKANKKVEKKQAANRHGKTPKMKKGEFGSIMRAAAAGQRLGTLPAARDVCAGRRSLRLALQRSRHDRETRPSRAQSYACMACGSVRSCTGRSRAY